MAAATVMRRRYSGVGFWLTAGIRIFWPILSLKMSSPGLASKMFLAVIG
jgi:hypothetical protein